MDALKIIAQAESILEQGGYHNVKISPQGKALVNAICQAIEEELPKKVSKMNKPTIEEVKLVAAKCGLPESEAEAFFAHYTANGWYVGRVPMKNWQIAMCVTWKQKWMRLQKPPERVSLYSKLVAAKELLAKADAKVRMGTKPNPRNYENGEQSIRYKENMAEYSKKIAERDQLRDEVEKLNRQIAGL